MTPEQRNAILGIVAGWSFVVTFFAAILFVLVADNLAQALVYSSFFFVITFAAIRWWMMRKFRNY